MGYTRHSFPPSSLVCRCTAYNGETRQYYEVEYDPFPSGEKNAPVLVREETGAGAGAGAGAEAEEGGYGDGEDSVGGDGGGSADDAGSSSMP